MPNFSSNLTGWGLGWGAFDILSRWTTIPVQAHNQLHNSNTSALCNKGWHFWKGGFVTDKTGLKIFVFINAMIFAFTTFVTNTPLYGKIASKVWKIYFQYISPHFLDAAGSQISDLWLLLLSNSSLFSALMSHLPLLLLHSAMILDNFRFMKTWSADVLLFVKCQSLC